MASIATTEEPQLAGGQDGMMRRSAVGEYHFEFGGYLPQVQLGFETWGTLAADGSNAVLVMHALTGDAHVASGDSATAGW